MSNKSNSEASKEEAILLAVKKAITLVVKDTATQPGLKHPLSDTTIEYLRHCLGLITNREQEIAHLTGRNLNQKPHFIDEQRDQLQAQDNVVVDFDPNIPKK